MMQSSFGSYCSKLSLVLLSIILTILAACGTKQEEIRVSALDHFRRGNAYFQQRQLQSAAEEYRLAIAQDPHQERFHYNLGLVYYSLVLYDLAIDHYEKAIEINPLFSEAWYNMALALEKLNRTEKAYIAFQKYQQLNNEQLSEPEESSKPIVIKKSEDTGTKR